MKRQIEVVIIGTGRILSSSANCQGLNIDNISMITDQNKALGLRE